jgi:predicted permease
VNAVLLRSLPYTSAERLVVLWGDNTITAEPRDYHAFDTFEDYRRGLEAAELVAGVTARWSFTLAGDNADPEQVFGNWATADFLSMLGVQPAIGRLLEPADEQPGATPVAVIGWGLWQRRFGGAPDIIGRDLRLSSAVRNFEGGSATIVGVLPPDFRWREGGEIWAPIAQNAFIAGGGRRVRIIELVARLKPDASAQLANSQAAAVAQRLAAEFPESQRGLGARVALLQDDVVGEIRPALLVLMAAVGLVLLIACANVASLMLVRGDGRRREVAVRMALGAARFRVAQELLAESTLLALTGGLLGLIGAFAGVRALMAIAPAGIPRRDEIAVDPGVFLFTLGLALFTGLLFGLAPVAEALRANPAGTLREGDRSRTSRGRTRSVLVVAEVALALMVAIGASLLARSFTRLQAVDPGFETRHVLSMDLSGLPATHEERLALMAQLYEHLTALNGVAAAGDVTRLPLAGVGGNPTTRLAIEGNPVPESEQPEIDFRRAARGYFEAMNIPLHKGRLFQPTDNSDAPLVALINDVAAARFFPGEDPVGRRVSFAGFTDPYTVIGVIGAVRHNNLSEEPRPEAYIHSLQASANNPQLVVRTRVAPESMVSEIRSTLRAVAPMLVVSRVATMADIRQQSLAAPRFSALLFGLFAALALVLATLGTYGVMAYTVAQRTREIGVRVSLGARPADVALLVGGYGLRLAVAGIALGLLGALATTHAMRSMLFGVSTTDLPTFVITAAVLTVAVLAACGFTARRAISVDPVEALRRE